MSLHLAVKIMKMQHHLEDDQGSLELIQLGHRLVQLTTKNMTLMPTKVVKILITASLILHRHTVLSKLHHMDTMMKTMIIKVTTVNSAIQI
jgi:methyl coenzyme M reductase beta subunit